jgi:riboflavin kinase/FMN adenylyltransferase
MPWNTNIRLIDPRDGSTLSLENDVYFVVVLGNFDGVHLAHTRLLRQGIALAKEIEQRSSKRVLCAAWTFATPSGDYFSSHPQKHLTTLEERLALFAANGITHVFLADFEQVRNTSPRRFINDILISRCLVVGTVCGYNFRFGKDGVGDPALLLASFEKNAVVVPQTALPDGERTVISSSAIRALLTNGEIPHANKLLGYPYFIHAPVLHGKQLGRTLGFPTINQRFPMDKLIPKCGIYASLCVLPDGSIYPGVSNIGKRPTVDGDGDINCETHIANVSLDLYDKSVTVCFIQRLRDEQCFSSLEDMQDAIRQDCENVKQYFSLLSDEKMRALCNTAKAAVAEL